MIPTPVKALIGKCSAGRGWNSAAAIRAALPARLNSRVIKYAQSDNRRLRTGGIYCGYLCRPRQYGASSIRL
jgi:hypothetical protein